MNRGSLSLPSAKNLLLAGVPCKPEVKIMVALDWLPCFMGICVNVPVKIGVKAFSNE